MYGSSSRNLVKQNPDGTYNVHCLMCGQFISKTMVRMGTAMCEICRRALNDEPISEDLVQQYQAGKGARSNVSLFVVPEPKIDGLTEKQRKFRLAGTAEGMLAAIGRFASGFKETVAEKAKKVSVQVAKGKRRGRLFENVDVDENSSGEGLGNISELDAQLEKNKTK